MRFIVLVGPKHSGKTSTGNALAQALSCGFIDLDEYIARKSGKSPRALYTEGPEILRKAEAEALAALFDPKATDVPSLAVIASGGGLADNPEALSLLDKNPAAITVFLDISAESAWNRIMAAGALPPFLKTENPRETHRSLHERRAEIYRQFAAHVINANGKSPGEIAREINNLALRAGD